MMESQWTIAGFMTRYEQLLATSRYSSYYKTYLATEAEHQQLFGNTRYKNYDSFQRSRKNYISKKSNA